MFVACGKAEVANKSYPPAGVQKGMRKIKGWGKSGSGKGRVIYGEKTKKKSRELSEVYEEASISNKVFDIDVDRDTTVLYWCIFFNKSMDLKAMEADWLLFFRKKDLSWKKLESTSEQE